MALHPPNKNIVNQYSSHVEHHHHNQNLYLIIKRVIDLILSIITFILTLPVVLITMLIIKFDSPGPALFVQERVGLNGRTFNIYKLRTMRTDAEINGPQWASTNDPRITNVGEFLRKTRIDELPQLVNVIKGDMSIVGPRPEREFFIKKFEREIPGFSKRLLVKPGLTGWAQVNGGYELSPNEKLNLDLYYIKHSSTLLDFSIMFKTISVIFTGEGAR